VAFDSEEEAEAEAAKMRARGLYDRVTVERVEKGQRQLSIMEENHAIWMSRAVAAERTRIVEWLRSRPAPMSGMIDGLGLADAIERGEHAKTEEPSP